MFLQVSADYSNLQAMVAGLYDDMLPLASQMISVATGIAGLGGIIFIFYKLWPTLAGGQPLDIYPLLRPFAIFLVLTFYTGVISLFNAVLSPVVEVTNGLVLDQNQAVLSTLKRKNELMERRAKERAYVRDQQQEDSLFNIAKKIGAVQDYIAGLPEVMESWLRMALNYILELLFFAAGLVINLIRTFYLIVLTLIGPLVIGFSVFPGFEGSLNSWIARYVQVYLWLPIANILGMIISRIQVLMVEQDLSRLLADGTYDGADMGYLLFLIMGIFSYLTIPSLAGFVIESSGAGRAVRELGQKGKTGAAMAGTGAGSVVGGLGGVSAPGYRGSMNTAENKGGVLSI